MANLKHQIAKQAAQSNTITLSNSLQPMTIGSLTPSMMGSMNSSLTPWESLLNTDYVKKYEVFQTTEDILALSVTWYRLRGNFDILASPFSRPTKLTDAILFQKMIQEDRDKANVIRDYYSKKIMMLTLKGLSLSNFRKDLNTFIHGDSKIVKEELMPLIYRLPEFYEYDIGTDEMFTTLDTRFTDSRVANSSIKTLYPVKEFIIKLKNGKYNEYWLRDLNNRPYKIVIENSNSLLHLWKYFFKKNSLTVDCISKFDSRDSHGFYKMIKWEILN